MGAFSAKLFFCPASHCDFYIKTLFKEYFTIKNRFSPTFPPLGVKKYRLSAILVGSFEAEAQARATSGSLRGSMQPAAGDAN
jgi:hypothetical protein